MPCKALGQGEFEIIKGPSVSSLGGSIIISGMPQPYSVTPHLKAFRDVYSGLFCAVAEAVILH